MKLSVCLALPMLAAIVLSGCEVQSGAPSETSGDAKTLSDRVESALGDVSSAAQGELEKQTERLLAALDERLDALAEQAAAAAETATRNAIDDMRMELEEKREEIRERLSALRDDTGDARAELRRELADTLSELRDLLESAVRSIDETDPSSEQAPSTLSI